MKQQILAFDFETTADINIPQVYSWGIYGKDYFKYGISINTFFDTLKTLDKTYLMFAHNFSKFDGHFIVGALKENGFIQKEYIENKKEITKDITSDYKTKKTVSSKDYDKYLKAYEYTVLVDKNKKIMELKIGLPSTKRNGSHHYLTIRDSNLLFTGSLKSYGETLEKVYNDEKYRKLSLNTGYHRTELYNSIQELENDGNELEYLKRDCFVLYEYLMYMSKSLPLVNWKMTAASTAYNQWVKLTGKEWLQKYIDKGWIKKVKGSKSTDNKPFFFYKWYGSTKLYKSTPIIKQIFNKLIPVKWLDDYTDEEIIKSQDIYKWYSGGLTMVNPMYKGIQFNNNEIDIYDIKSSYPSSMFDGVFPMGIPFNGDGGDAYPLKLYEIIVTDDCTNEKGLPFIGSLTGTAKLYTKTLKKGLVFYITDVEYERFLKYYKGKFIATIKYSFKSIKGSELFGTYIGKYYEIKETMKKSDIGQTIIAKLFLNALYGKFGSKSEITSHIWNDEDKVWEKERAIMNSKFYLPIAIWVTAQSRMKLVDAVGDNYNHFVYCDTDSIFLLNNHRDKFNFIEGDKLGNWEREKINVNGIIRRPKQYMMYYDVDGKTKFKHSFAGIRYSDEVPSIAEFINGISIKGQIKPIKTPTGVFLEEIEKNILPIWEYEPHPEDWFKNKKEYVENYSTYKEYLKKYLV